MSLKCPAANAGSVLMTNNNQPPTEVELQSLYSRFLDLLRDYNTSSSDWRKFLVEELTEVYQEVLSFADVDGVKNNPFYKLITFRTLEEHLIIAKPTHRTL